jgi:1,4-alpha-glucan branching enzyme
VVYGKHSLLGRMPGDHWQRFANLRAYFGFMWSHPGKKLLFMGDEFGQEREWNHDTQPDWDLLDTQEHRGIQRLVRDLNRLYTAEPALYARDYQDTGFRWVVADDREQSVFAYLRIPTGNGMPLMSVVNFTPVPRNGYQLGVPEPGKWLVLLNTDAACYGGSDFPSACDVRADSVPWRDQPASLALNLPPLAMLILRPDGADSTP